MCVCVCVCVCFSKHVHTYIHTSCVCARACVCVCVCYLHIYVHTLTTQHAAESVCKCICMCVYVHTHTHTHLIHTHLIHTHTHTPELKHSMRLTKQQIIACAAHTPKATHPPLNHPPPPYILGYALGAGNGLLRMLQHASSASPACGDRITYSYVYLGACGGRIRPHPSTAYAPPLPPATQSLLRMLPLMPL